jgi:hypothetical protein
MLQHLVVDPVQSVSAWQSLSPVDACSQTFCAPWTSERSTQALPIVVSHFASLVQKMGQVLASWHTLPPDP